MGKYTYQGLTQQEVEKSRQEHGANELPPIKVESFFDKLKENFEEPLIKILVVALVITLFLSFFGYAEWYEGIGIAFAVFLATFVATYSEYKNETSFQKLQEKASRIKNNVFRGGEVVNIFAQEIVVGDHVLLQAGDKIPADGVLLTGHLEADQSSLNGEPTVAVKEPADITYNAPSPKDFLDKYLVFRGTVVQSGEAVLYVRGVGQGSVYGQIADDLSQTDDRESPLQVKLSALADGISSLGYVGAIFIAISFLFKQFVVDNGYNYVQIIKYVSHWQVALHDVVTSIILGIIIIVVAVPEGLPMMIAIVLSLNMRKLLKAKVLVRKLLGIETAGSVDILFVDKTGTLTHGKFSPKLFIDGDLAQHKGFSEIPKPLQQALAFAVRESTSSAVGPTGQIVGGNASDRALLEFLDRESLLAKLDVEIVSEVLFSSARKFSSVTVKASRSQKLLPSAISSLSSSADHIQVAALKGAPEIILSRCTHYIDGQGHRKAFDKVSRPLENQVNELSTEGIRVIAVALTTETNFDDAEVPQGLTLVGVVGVYDELRPESAQAVKEAKAAGIQVVMITGDRKETAASISRQVGLLDDSPAGEKYAIITSDELQKLVAEDKLQEVMPSLRVIARALPTDKSKVVRVAQAMGKVVGMTGDGVNDGAALKQADVGFAMGSGAEVAKEAADIVILDDNFSSITKAVLYGRTIYKSIQKFIVFQSTINLASSLIVFLGPFLGVDFPLTLIQLLWVNLVMDTLAALAFGGEPALQRYMKEKPIKRNNAIITKRMWFTLATGGVFIASACLTVLRSSTAQSLFVRNGKYYEPAFLTAFFAFFIFLAVLNAFNVRTSRLKLTEDITKNKGFILVVTFIFAVQIAFSVFGGKVLRTVGLSYTEWATVISASAIIIPYGLLCKIIYGNLSPKSQQPRPKTD